MDLRQLTPRLRDLAVSLRDLCLVGLVVSPIWVLLGVLAHDGPMIAFAIATALASGLTLRPALAATLRDASAALLPRPLRVRALPRALVLFRARA